jgi:hypothetical protein
MYTDVQYADIAGANICGDAQNYTRNIGDFRARRLDLYRHVHGKGCAFA